MVLTWVSNDLGGDYLVVIVRQGNVQVAIVREVVVQFVIVLHISEHPSYTWSRYGDMGMGIVAKLIYVNAHAFTPELHAYCTN